MLETTPQIRSRQLAEPRTTSWLPPITVLAMTACPQMKCLTRPPNWPGPTTLPSFVFLNPGIDQTNERAGNDSAFSMLGDLIVFLIVRVDVGLCFAGRFQGVGFLLIIRSAKTVWYLYWFTFDNAYQRRRGCNRTELETRLFKEQPIFFFSSFNAAWKY
jgi:hypothetical protein